MVCRLAAAGVAIVFLLTGLQACSSASSTPLPRLSATNPSQNLPAIISAVQRLCLEHVTETDGFDGAIAATGWDFRQTQQADQSTTLDVWQAHGVEVIHSRRPIQAPDAEVWVCSLKLQADLMPEEGSVTDAITELAGQSARHSENGPYWEWRPSPLRAATATLNELQNPGGLMIVVELAAIDPARAIFGK